MEKLTQNCQRIINLLGDYPARSFFTKEISDKLNISLGGTHNALKYLLKEKNVKVKQRGNMKFYKIAVDNPFIRQFRVAAAVNKLMPLVGKIKNDSREIILFGSASRGEQTASSDIDLFILAHEPEKVRKAIFKYKRKMPLKAVIKTPNEWSELEVREPEFYREIRQGVKLFQS